MMAPEDNSHDSGSDSDAPEVISFSEAKEASIKQKNDHSKQILDARQKKKQANKERHEQWAEQKRVKQQKEEAKRARQLPMDVIDTLNDDVMSKRFTINPNKVKKFDDDEEEDDDDEDDEVSFRNESHQGPNLKLVSRRDERGLNHVAPSVLNFRQQMLFGKHNRRESAESLRLRKQKAKANRR